LQRGSRAYKQNRIIWGKQQIIICDCSQQIKMN
jgi:hypothetical protein